MMRTKIKFRFRLEIPEGHAGLERLVLGPEFERCVVRDMDGLPVLMVPTPAGVPLVIRSGDTVTAEQADAIVWHFTTNLGGRHITAL